jgi:hypothetical protein
MRWVSVRIRGDRRRVKKGDFLHIFLFSPFFLSPFLRCDLSRLSLDVPLQNMFVEVLEPLLAFLAAAKPFAEV